MLYKLIENFKVIRKKTGHFNFLQLNYFNFSYVLKTIFCIVILFGLGQYLELNRLK